MCGPPRGGFKRPTHPPQSLTCGHEFMLNSLQRTTCKFCSVALISNKVIEHNTAPFSLLKKCLHLNDQNGTRAVNVWKYFSKMFNPRVNNTLHNKKNLNILVTFEVYNVHFIFRWGLLPATPSKF